MNKHAHAVRLRELITAMLYIHVGVMHVEVRVLHSSAFNCIIIMVRYLFSQFIVKTMIVIANTSAHVMVA